MRQISTLLSVAGLLAGFVVAISVLSGDEQGRVNLLYLLLLFVFLPAGGLLLSVVYLFRQSGRGLAGWILELPLWPVGVRREMLALQPGYERKYWLFYETQLLALAFALGGLLAFLILLAGTDISFVWRSTLLNATDLLPLLQILALPWRFWTDAQPDLALLQQSQDFRLAEPQFTAARLGQWWKYAIAAQITYTLLPRALLALVAHSLFQRRNAAAQKRPGHRVLHVDAMNIVPMQGKLAPLAGSVPEDYVMIDWANIPPTIKAALEKRFGQPGSFLQAGPLTEPEARLSNRARDVAVVVMVKAWEPPMGELGDYLLKVKPASSDAPGLLLPLDWDGEGLRPVKDVNLREWRRFCGTLPGGWSVLQAQGNAGAAA